MTQERHSDKRIELKYLLSVEVSAEIRKWACERLESDPHCNECPDGYRVSTLYLDTLDLDLFHQTRVAGRAKYRIRRYGTEDVLWLESKLKKQEVVRKSRICESEAIVYSKLDAAASDAIWCGDWFLKRINEKKLVPTLQVQYRRFARSSVVDDRSLRLTIDNDLTFGRASGWQVANALGGLDKESTATELVEILELKFHNDMPPLFKELLRQFAIQEVGFSKYRTGIQQLLLSPDGSRLVAGGGCGGLPIAESINA